MNSMKASPRTNSGRRAARWKARAGPPILRDEISLIDTRRGDEPIEIAHVVLEAVRDLGLAGLTETDEVRRNAVRRRRHLRDDVAPDVGGGRVAVQEEGNGRVGAAHLPIGHLRAEH
jgi:hypothetical protein